MTLLVDQNYNPSGRFQYVLVRVIDDLVGA